MKRIFEVVLGLVITVGIFGGYSDGIHPVKHFIEYVTTDAVLQFIFTITLITLASRLIAGKPNDCSKFSYNMLVKLFGEPRKRKNVQ